MSAQSADINTELTVISTFAGCGGSSLGYKWAGFKELLAIEWEDNAVETFKLNFPEVPIWQRDICTVTGKEILDFCKIKKGELDIFDGSPPCQGFSTAGKRNVNDSRNDLFKEYCRLIKELQPKVFVMENVSGMIKGKMKGMFFEILSELKSCGYDVKCKLMNAMWYEVPQSRERLFFIGIRNDLNIKPSFPLPTKTFISFAKATKGLPKQVVPELSNFLKEIVPKMKQGQNADDISGKGGFQTTRIFPNRPAPTITKIIGGIGFGMNIHPTEDRVLSIDECKRISSFPDNFKLIGKFQEQRARLGNAVMPKMMFHIARHIRQSVFKSPVTPSEGQSAPTAKETGEKQAN